jgi:hypothetical protein
VPLVSRVDAFLAMLDIVSRTHGFDATTISRSPQRKTNAAGEPSEPFSAIRTCAINYLYHHFSNDVLFTEDPRKRLRVFAGVAEVWLHVMLKIPGGGQSNEADRGVLSKINDLLWFLLDAILRSMYLHAHDTRGPRGQKFDASLFAVLRSLVVELARHFAQLGNLPTVQKMALFCRNLTHVCDRGQALSVFASLLKGLERESTQGNTQSAIRVFLEDEDAAHLFCPSPRIRRSSFLAKIIIDTLAPQFVNSARDLRSNAAVVLYTGLCRMVNSRHVSAEDLSYIAMQFLELVQSLALSWSEIRSMTSDKSNSAGPLDRRMVLAIVNWILFYAPEPALREWTKRQDPKVVVGFMQMLADAQSSFRFLYGKDKVETKVPPELQPLLEEWDARYSTFATMLCTRILSNLLQDFVEPLRTVKHDKAHPMVFPFFLMLESVLHLGNSTAALQGAAAVLFQVVAALFPEILSNKARMSSGVVLLAFRMISSSSIHVRDIAANCFLNIARHYYDLTGSLGKLKYHTANALVAVAEAKQRELRLAEKFIADRLLRLIERTAEKSTLSQDAASRYEEDQEPSGDSRQKYSYVIRSQFMSVQRVINISRHLTQPRGSHAEQPSLTEEFTTMARSTLSLFRDVLKLQVDDTMKIKEAKGIAYFQVFSNFLSQNCIKEAFKWLQRLLDFHKSNSDNVEAAMALVLLAAVGYRVTEVFYASKGESTKGCRMPATVLQHVFWHDYVRILPELEALLRPDNIYVIVSNMHVVPEEIPFTMEGQIRLLKQAMDLCDKGQYYELSVRCGQLLLAFLSARNDWKSSAIVHESMSNLCKAVRSASREDHKYFFFWARMEREQMIIPKKRRSSDDEDDEDDEKAKQQKQNYLSKEVKRVFKMPHSFNIEQFKTYALEYAISLVPDRDLVVVTDDITGTQPALPVVLTASGKITKTTKANLAVPNRCMVTVSEVMPFASQEERVPTETSDRARSLDRFQNVLRVGGKITQPLAKQSKQEYVLSTNLPQSNFNVMEQRLNINIHRTERGFPTATVAVDVASTEEQLLDAFETAVETVEECYETAVADAVGPNLIASLVSVLQPMGIVPAGLYLKEVVRHMHQNKDVMKSVKKFLELCRAKLQEFEQSESFGKSPEKYALVLKALADVECAIIDNSTNEDQAKESDEEEL